MLAAPAYLGQAGGKDEDIKGSGGVKEEEARFTTVNLPHTSHHLKYAPPFSLYLFYMNPGISVGIGYPVGCRSRETAVLRGQDLPVGGA